MKTKQLNWPSIEEQKQYWIDKEAQSNNATNETRPDLCDQRDELLAALKKVDRWLPRCPARYDEIEICKTVRSAITNTEIQPLRMSRSEGATTADPKPEEEDLSRTEATTDWYDHHLNEDYWSLRDAGRNPDGSGESYAERNV